MPLAKPAEFPCGLAYVMLSILGIYMGINGLPHGTQKIRANHGLSLSGCTWLYHQRKEHSGHMWAPICIQFPSPSSPERGYHLETTNPTKNTNSNGDVICIVLCIKKMYFHHPKPGSAALMVSPMREPWFTYEMWSLDVRA